MSGKHSAARVEGQGSRAQCWRAKLFSKRAWATSKPAELTENKHVGEHVSGDDGREPRRDPHTHVGAATTSDGGNQRALQLVQSLVKDTVRAAVANTTRELREVVDQHLATQAAPANGTFPVGSGGGIASMPSGGLLPPTTALSGMPVMPAVPTAGPASSSSLTPIMSLHGQPSNRGT